MILDSNDCFLICSQLWSQKFNSHKIAHFLILIFHTLQSTARRQSTFCYHTKIQVKCQQLTFCQFLTNTSVIFHHSKESLVCQKFLSEFVACACKLFAVMTIRTFLLFLENSQQKLHCYVTCNQYCRSFPFHNCIMLVIKLLQLGNVKHYITLREMPTTIKS